MRNHNGATYQPAAFVLAFGVLGGATLITAVSISTRGPVIFLPYAAIVLACAALLRAERGKDLAAGLLCTWESS
jgi:hypothetical protein